MRLTRVSAFALLIGMQSAADAQTTTADGASQAAPTASATDAPSAGTGDQLEDIVVTAQKRTENVQSVPIAIAALTGSQLVKSGVPSTLQLNVAVPGLNTRTTAGSFLPSIRGVGTSSNNVENPVALYIDGVYIPFQREGLRSLNDIEQISVLKGPQGTLFGRNATGGVIQITTKTPSHTFAGEVGAELDNYLTLRSDAYVTGGLTDTVAASLSASYAVQGNGWGQNSTTGVDTHRIRNDWSLRGKALYQPSARTDVTLIADFQHRNETNGSYYAPYPGTTFRVPGYIRTKNVYDSTANLDGVLGLDAGGGSVTLVQDLDFAKLTSISAYRRAHATYTYDVDGTANLGQNGFSTNDTRQYSQELQLVSRQNRDFRWSTGLYYLNYQNKVDPFVRQYGGVVAPLPTSTSQQTINARELTESVSPFAQIDFSLFDKTRLTLGARETFERRHFVASNVAIRNNGTSTATQADSSVNVKRPTWRVSLDHQFTQHVLGYVSYNRGFKSGGYNVVNPANPSYSPEKLDAYEAGLKTELLDNRVRLNGAVFYYDYSGIQLTQYSGAVAFITNAAKAKLYGIDADFQARVTGDFRLSGGISLLHANFTSFPGAAISSINPAGGIFVNIGDVSGNRIQLAQKVSGSLTATYTKKLDTGTIEVSGTESYNGDYFFEPDNFARQPAYSIVNGSVSWTSPSQKMTLSLFVRNLLDKRLIGQAGSLSTIGLFADYSYPPRLFGGSARFHF